MKKNFRFAFVGAIALLGAVGISSCSSSSDEVINNPDYDPTTNSVKTQFTISLPGSVKSQTRMPDATVLQASAFSGIGDIKLIPYTGVPAASSALTSMMDLASITSFDYETSKTKVYSDVRFDQGVAHFVFYGTSIAPTSGKFNTGSLTISNRSTDKTLNDIGFGLEQAYNSTNEGVGTALIAALNAVANATPLDQNGETTLLTDENTWGDSDTGTDGTQHYKFYEVTSEMNTTLNTLLTKFKSLKVNSSKKVMLVLRDLYSNLEGLVTTAAFNTVPKAATMSMGIRKAIEAQFATSTAVATSELKNGLTGYPANCNIPDGAARVAWDGTNNCFAEANTIGVLDVAAKTNYVYPANLQYFVNSTIKTSDNTQSTNYSGKTWDQVKALYTTGTSVGANTRSVLIENPIQFAVASLETKVRLKNNVTVLTDNTPTTPASITIPEGGYELTGVLVGNQKSVDWQFLPKPTAPELTIYDQSVKAGIKTVYCDATVQADVDALISNYTLVLATEADSPTHVALEFLNPTGASDFLGADGTIIAGEKFYLVGTLTPAAGEKVFTQDFTTRAVFTLPDNALSKAYTGLPDLRTPQMELGLSVDLTWQQGTTYNVEF